MLAGWVTTSQELYNVTLESLRLEADGEWFLPPDFSLGNLWTAPADTDDDSGLGCEAMMPSGTIP